MQNKNTKHQSQLGLKLAHERAAAATIVVGMLVGSIAVSQEVRRAVSEFAAHPILAVIEHSNRESETAHRAMRLESDMSAELIGGE